MRLLAKSVLDTITRGKRLTKSVATTAIVPRPVIANAQIWLRRRTRTTASTSAAIPIAAGSTGGKTLLSFRSTATFTVQIRNTAPSAAATTDNRREAAAGSFQQIPLGAQREVGGAVEREDRNDREPRQQGVGVEQVPERSVEVAAVS